MYISSNGNIWQNQETDRGTILSARLQTQFGSHQGLPTFACFKEYNWDSLWKTGWPGKDIH
jgi:hypothetical protein